MADYKTEEEIAEQRNLTVGQVRQLKRAQGLTNEALAAIPERGLRSALRRLEIPDRPRAREQFRLLQTVGDTGMIAPDAMPNALRQLDSSRQRATNLPRIAGVPTGRRVTPSRLAGPLLAAGAGLLPDHTGWTSIGPGNVGGRTRSIVLHPTNPDVLWVGSVGGGVWLTVNGGVSWDPVDDLMANLAVSCMVMDPDNENAIYAGTGEGFSNIGAIRGAGIFRTTDAVHWTQLSATTGEDYHYVNRLAVSSDGQVLFAATNSGIFRSEDPDRQHWVRTFDEAAVADLVIDPTDDRHLVAGGLDNGQAYVSTDGGHVWRQAGHSQPWQGRVELAIAAADPTIVYASIEMTVGEIWRSTNGGETYAKRAGALANGDPAEFLGEQGWYDNTIWAGDPTDSDLVIVGGVDLWRSRDGGDTLIDISTWWEPTSVHADHHAIVADPRYDGTTNKTVYFANDGGIYKTEDVHTVGNDPDPPRVSGWSELVNTYAVTQFYGGVANAQTGTIVGGAQDNGTLAFTPAGGSEGWIEIFGGDGGYVASDPDDPQIFYGEYVFLNIHRNTDGATTNDLDGDRYISGQFWNPNKFPKADWDWKSIPFRIPDAKNQNALFIAPFVLDPNNPERILAGGISLWRTNDARTPNTMSSGPSWEAVKGFVGQRISAIAIAQGNSDLVWVGYDGGLVFKTENGTDASPTWVRIDQTGPGPLTPRRFCTRIVIDPNDHETVYAMFGGYENDNVWRTTHGGKRWVNIATSIPDVPVRTLAIHPRNPQFLYLGTEVGVFTSETSGSTWSPTNEGPTNCAVYELFWMGEVLVAATHGRGMFQIDLSDL